MKKPLVLILSGDGINCQNETAWAFNLAGAVSHCVHVNDLLENPDMLLSYHGMAFPGGFSFGDELGSGQLLAIKMKNRLKAVLDEAVKRKMPMIGICNGLQVLTKLGLLPDWNQERTVAMAHNRQGHFIDQWVEMKALKSRCIWTQGIEDQTVSVPVRHGEGRFTFTPGSEEKVYQQLKDNGQIVFRYNEDINGSYDQIAGICDPTGMILGLMPHPEAVLYQATLPAKSLSPLDTTWAMKIFENAVTTMTKQMEKL
ncbi:MAG: phosphoribosylformylglycinamidine synthase [Bdellovibrio sp. CG12_big_fil_rev_8_21_14_0_65_39_13]|nr:MAG: phosphoribosylformylglycinamidine synthase [Bdellovibrio sp. CG22_combo_CG10-13_8_21_14_all_39_27]PIQ58322.1 MAG: phosphoribosylformylglycinamidine synthase [Bdellovibrio sp. CG12_big_fil_rev_8_21_14_0_65_39_13]PIR35834.1 MAG: phosphoribosylformylglycinamidine synthase [Bdellovibrio sp. CG11_big_fil_rev_8_21_14_0_20_39_38]